MNTYAVERRSSRSERRQWPWDVYRRLQWTLRRRVDISARPQLPPVATNRRGKSQMAERSRLDVRSSGSQVAERSKQDASAVKRQSTKPKFNRSPVEMPIA
uniref:(northern house mosquito) hypothetical protein n=1 Tax=Culex pipiens TaxID=7175 RepID=A0A8D8AV41_CULPI